MKTAGKILVTILLLANALAVVLMAASAYSVYFSPIQFPSLSLLGLFFPVFLATNILFIGLWLLTRKRHVMLSLFGCLLCANAIRQYIPVNWTVNPPGDTIKVLSYNVFHYGAHGTKNWDSNDVLQFIKHSDADIVCVQEDYWGTGEELDVELSNYPYKQHNGINKTTLGLFSKYPVLWSEIIPYETESNGSVAYYLLMEEDTVLVINNHFESYKLTTDDKTKYSQMIHADDSNKNDYIHLYNKMKEVAQLRSSQVDAVAAYVERSGCRYVILCGDFNDTPVSYAHQRMMKKLYDVHTASGNGFDFTYNRNRMYVRIDHLMLSDSWQAYGAKVDKTINTSDHYPLLAYIKKKR